MPSVIALDAMGSDRRPKPEIEGAIQAARHYDVHILLIGPESALRAELSRYPSAAGLPINVVHASEVIGMDDKAVQAVRAKRDSSMRVGLRLVRDGRASGFITAGNTGAAMATAKMVLGAIPGLTVPRWQLCFLRRSALSPVSWTSALTSIASRTISSNLRSWEKSISACYLERSVRA